MSNPAHAAAGVGDEHLPPTNSSGRAQPAPRLRHHLVRPYRSAEHLSRDQQLAWQIAEVAAGSVTPIPEVQDMVINRVIDNAGVAAAALSRPPVIAAREQAVGHMKRIRGASVVGLSSELRISPEWAAWANGVAVRELDFHDTFLAADYSHPADNIPAILAVAQHCGLTGADVVRAIATAYEIQVALVRGICLHKHRIDHIAHLGPSVAAGIGALLRLNTEAIFKAIGQALHVTTTTRQSRKGEISTWKAYAPAFASKMAVEAVDRAMRGQSSPAPIYEGEDGFIAWLLDGPEAEYDVRLPVPGTAGVAILDTYTKQHSAEYQAQALIDLARRMRSLVTDFERIHDIVIHTSHHTHSVIGTGAGDPQKLDPYASRETLDHSIMYIFAVALQDGVWHHERSYARDRATRSDTVALWHKVRTTEDPEWTRRYHDPDPEQRAFGGRVTITMEDGMVIEDELAVADAHPRGAHPYEREDYIEKFRVLADGIIADEEQERFLDLVQRLPELTSRQLRELTFTVEPELLGPSLPGGIF